MTWTNMNFWFQRATAGRPELFELYISYVKYGIFKQRSKPRPNGMNHAVSTLRDNCILRGNTTYI